MLKKILAVVAAVAVMMTCGMVAFAAETPTDVVPEIVLQLEANGAQGKMADIPVDENGEVVIPEPTFVNDNYNFTGWNTTADGAGESYKAGDKIKLEQTLMIYAQWVHKDAVIVEYTLTYDANGGEGETIDFYGPYMEGMYAYTAYNEFTKGTATFVGWNTKADGTGTMYAEDEMFEIYSDVVLYAIWEGGEEVIVDEPKDEDEIVEEDVTGTNPPTGSAPVAGAAIAGVVALAALVVFKKRG